MILSSQCHSKLFLPWKVLLRVCYVISGAAPDEISQGGVIESIQLVTDIRMGERQQFATAIWEEVISKMKVFELEDF